jgi:uncharacterized protein YbjT (DUF2867 family)
MTEASPILLTGVGGGESNISRLAAAMLLGSGSRVRTLIHRDDGRADELKALGAEVIVGDLRNPRDVARAMDGVRRVFFNMSVSKSYLEAAAVVASIADESGNLEAFVNMSQMTVSQMTSTSAEESEQQRLHWLVERLLTWSPLPVVELRPTVFLDNPMFTFVPRQSIATQHVLALPIGAGRTSPVAATDVARVVATVLREPGPHVGQVYELTGPEVLGVDDLADRYGRALNLSLTGADVPFEVYEKQMNSIPGIPAHVVQHVLTVARLHRADRYNRLTDDVERVTGRPAESVEEYIASNRDLFVGSRFPG